MKTSAKAVQLSELVNQLCCAGKHDTESLLAENLAIHRRVLSPMHSDTACSLFD